MEEADDFGRHVDIMYMYTNTFDLSCILFLVKYEYIFNNSYVKLFFFFSGNDVEHVSWAYIA